MRGRPPLLHHFLLVASLLSSVVQASVGDRSPAYSRCIQQCTTARCSPSSSSTSDPSAPWSSFPTSSPLWSCPATCSYACQSHLTALSLSLPVSPSSSPPPSSLEGLPTGHQVQFHGKWPFHRLDLSSTPPLSWPPLSWVVTPLIPATQEPLSVLFSLGNLWAHWQGYKALRRQARGGRMREGKNLAKVYQVYACTGLVAWVCSAVFHIRDVGWTEKADYFAAAGTLLVGLWAGAVRMMGWYSLSRTGSTPATLPFSSTRPAFFAFTLALVLFYTLHLSYLLSTPRFNYTYNMLFNVLLALCTITLYASWTLSQSRLPNPSNFSRRQLSSYPSARARFRAPHYLSPLPPLIALPALSALELLDFPPVGLGTGLRLLDAHALWHLATIPVVVAWYRFLVKDVRWIDGQGEGGDPSGVLPGGSAIGEGDDFGSSASGGSGSVNVLLAGAALAKRRMTNLGAGLGLGIFGTGESRRGSLAYSPFGRRGSQAAAGEGGSGSTGAGGNVAEGRRGSAGTTAAVGDGSGVTKGD